MTWAERVAAVDAAVYKHLADDVAAPLLRAGVQLAALPVILDQVERPSTRQGLATIERADVARISVVALEAAAPGARPAAGDQFVIAGGLWTVHGEPWRDEESGRRDWLCPVTGRAL